MTDRRGEQGFSVAPVRVDGGEGGWRRRRRRIATWLVLAVTVAIVAIGVVGPRLQERPSLDLSFLATPTPRESPSPTVRSFPAPTTTPLPEFLRGAGPIPPGTIAVQTEMFRLLEPASGTVTDGPVVQFGMDAVVRSPTGSGWRCICSSTASIDGVPNRILQILEIDRSGRPADPTELAVLGPIDSAEGRPPAIGAGVDVTADGRVAIVALTERQTDDSFRFSAAGLSLVDLRLSPFEAVGSAASPARSPAGPSTAPSPGPGEPGRPFSEVYVDGPHVRIAPDGGVAFVWATLQRETSEGEASVSTVAWRLDLRPDGSVASVADAPTVAAMPPYCGYAGFATADRFAWICSVEAGTASDQPGWALQLIGPDGQAAGRVPIVGTWPRYLGEPLFDRANGAVYLWDPIGLALFRVDLQRMTSERVVFDPAAELTTGVAPGGGTARPDWHDADSPLSAFGYGEIAGAADGSRLYLLGLEEGVITGGQSQASRGIFVVDRATLALVDRWAPAANYQMLAMALDDRAVAASSFAGSAADGRPAPWQNALTLHDPVDGRVIAQFGRLGDGLPPLVLER